MTKQELVNDLRQVNGSYFITRQEVARFFGKKDPHNIDYLLHGLDRVEKRYYIRDIADAIIRHKAVKI